MATNYTVNGVDIEGTLVPKSYLLDRYPELADNLRFAGLWTWGYNTDGQLGNSTTTARSSPIQTISGGANWKQVSNSSYTTAGIKTDGTLWIWGYNLNGQFGNNSTTNRSSPVQTVAAGTNWKQVACGAYFTSAIKTDGTLWTWGSNANGSLGDNTTNWASSPIQTVSAGTNWKQVACGNYHAAAIKTDGTLWLWGSNGGGQLGDNSITNASSPIQTVSAGTNWKQVACGVDHTAAIKIDGTLWLWGSNFNGKLGDNTTTNRSSPVQTVAGGTNWKQVACGEYLTAAVKTDGTLWTWGYNTFGSLGDNTNIDKSSPVQTIAGGTNWKQVTCGQMSAAAIKTDGTLWLWGRNFYGNLGNNLRTTASSPVQTVTAGTNWRVVSMGSGSSTVAIRDDSSDIL